MTGSLRVGSLLAPSLAGFYRAVAGAAAARLGREVEFVGKGTYEEYASDGYDLAFVCGLAYVELAGGPDPAVPVAAPVVRGGRYGGRSIYWSDVVVRAGSGIGSFGDLRGRAWAYNEPLSQSGYGITRFHLLQMGETGGFFGRVAAAGSHRRALRMVLDGEADGAAIDSHLLGVILRDDPPLSDAIRIVDSLGPSPIQPVVVSRRLDEQTRGAIADAFTALHRDPNLAEAFESAQVERFVAAGPEDYDPIRRMADRCRAAGFADLR